MAVRQAIPDDAAAIARVHVNTWRTAYRGIVHDDVLDNLSMTQKTQQWRDWIEQQGLLVFVAENDDGEIVGFCSGGLNRDKNMPYHAEVYTLYVLHDHQRQGHGRALMRAIVAAFLARGYRSMLIWVLEHNPQGRAFYENMGGVPLTQKEFVLGDQPLIEIGYGWSDLSTLAE
jgi:ribosomal protein S18 acetylase RimI-like enzyme